MRASFIGGMAVIIALLPFLTGISGAEHACITGDGTAFFCGDTVTASCMLNGSMTCLNGDNAGSVIGADGVVIDGDSYTITGTATPANCEWASEGAPCTVSGIYDPGYDDVVIRNMGIEGFCTGIALEGTGPNMVRNITVENCRIHNNGFNTTTDMSEMTTHGIHACWIEGAEDEPALTVTYCDIYNNEGTGSGCGDGGNGIFIYLR